jgi:hypothetical protein
VGSEQNEFPVPEVRHPDLAGNVRRQEALDEPRQRADVARFGQHRLQLALGRKDAVELGKSHKTKNGREGLCRLS